MSVLVFGSLNLDIVFNCTRAPLPGETVLCNTYRTNPGGKGLNQAVAARRAGSSVAMVGAVGDDANGTTLLDFLAAELVDTGHIARASEPTGVAHIIVDEVGENSIVVAAGANRSTERWSGSPPGHKIALAQLEVEIRAVAGYFTDCRRRGMTCILNAAPAVPGARMLFPLCDVIVVNEHELAAFAATEFDPADEEAIRGACAAIADLSEQTVVVTLGARGTLVVDHHGSTAIDAVRVRAVDTTGAGDCFCGVLADGMARNMSIASAVRRANRAASIAVQRPGAAQAMPTFHEINAASATSAPAGG